MVISLSAPSFSRNNASHGSHSDGFQRVERAVKEIAPDVDVVMQDGRVNYFDDGWKPLASLVFYNNGYLYDGLTSSKKPDKLLVSKVNNSGALLGKLQYS
jgi:hypothetical protein